MQALLWLTFSDLLQTVTLHLNVESLSIERTGNNIDLGTGATQAAK